MGYTRGGGAFFLGGDLRREDGVAVENVLKEETKALVKMTSMHITTAPW